MKGEWRQRLDSGYYTIALSGIYQLDKDYFLDKSTRRLSELPRLPRQPRDARPFRHHRQVDWGWDGLVPTDSLYYSDYGLSSYQRNAIRPRPDSTEGLYQVYITGRGNRSYFDARSIYYYGFSVADVQSQIPIIHPVVDYFYTFGQPVLGGELGFRTNLTSLSRNTAAFDPISQFAIRHRPLRTGQRRPAGQDPANCLLRGIPGNYSRFSAEANWKRTYTDTIGQQWTPFASLRGDVAAMSIENQIGVSNYIAPGDRAEVRAMPAAGLEYRYPFINVQSWGTQTIEPIAQFIVRPNETIIGKLPERRCAKPDLRRQQSVQDQQIQRLGPHRRRRPRQRRCAIHRPVQPRRLRQRAVRTIVSVVRRELVCGRRPHQHRLDSGLDTTRSDYVARLAYQPDRTYTFRHPLPVRPGQTWDLNRFEVEGRAASTASRCPRCTASTRRSRSSAS